MDSYAEALLWAGLLGLFAALPLTVASVWLWLRLAAVPTLLSTLWALYFTSPERGSTWALACTAGLTLLLCLGYVGGLLWKGVGPGWERR